jgi:hypothetical protein
MKLVIGRGSRMLTATLTTLGQRSTLSGAEMLARHMMNYGSERTIKATWGQPLMQSFLNSLA